MGPQLKTPTNQLNQNQTHSNTKTNSSPLTPPTTTLTQIQKNPQPHSTLLTYLLKTLSKPKTLQNQNQSTPNYPSSSKTTKPSILYHTPPLTPKTNQHSQSLLPTYQSKKHYLNQTNT